jgi:hypothetical protein
MNFHDLAQGFWRALVIYIHPSPGAKRGERDRRRARMRERQGEGVPDLQLSERSATRHKQCTKK